ncbi:MULTISPECIES: transglycosylase SLT domain-containing protein [unclassified Nocardioides]|uniref:transglycosylase SLT domain-containing protein n=1 Tax=unclassified Nocardioides TaxID=2615069 RepID=UPI0006FF9178|nr:MULTISPECIES: transglycosylase SLT domain-containing protein [unclassified Nocardioides]KRA31153.1 lytic transglycosylase [Nocardioides sp. Root614]KRA87773.1 lytic transglycosylase [Nocardioides sp. Root682]
MSIDNVTARIGQIQAQLAQFATTRPASTGFANALTTETVAASAASPSGAGDVSGADVVAEAKKYVGLPYVWGGTNPEKGMDCSGLVQVVYRNLGYDLPRVSNQQAQAGRPVASMAEAQPGDLIAWDNSSRNNGVDHIAIYIGDGKMIEAPRTGLDIRVVDVPSTPDVIRRILPDGASAAATPTSGAAARVSDATPYAGLINAAAARTGVPGELLAAVAKQESGFNPKAVSPAGAQGLMQLMPGTARGLGVENPFDPAQAIDGAARLLRSLIDRFGQTDLALAAYNAGPGAVARYDGIPPYRETQNYVRNVMAMVND